MSLRLVADRVRANQWSIDLEVPSHSIQSVLEIRHYLTRRATTPWPTDELADFLRQLRAAWPPLLGGGRPVLERTGWHNWFEMLELDCWEIGDAFGALRATFGYGIAVLAAKWNVEVPDELVDIMPLGPDDDPADDPVRRHYGP